MNEKRREDYERIIELNNSAYNLYQKLCSLEIDGKFLNGEYKEYILLIKKINDMTKKIYLKYSLNDNFINAYIDNIIYDKKIIFNEYIKNINDRNNFSYKRFIEDIGELNLEHNITNGINLDNIDISANDEIQELLDGNNFLANILESLISNNNEIQQKINTNLILEYNRLNLYVNTLMNYVLDEINNLANIELKNRLIKFKYNMLCLYRTLENNFLINQRKFTQANLFQEAFVPFYPKEIKYFAAYDISSCEYMENVLSIFIDKGNEYYNYEEVFNDLLTILQFKTLLSLISSNANLNTIKQGMLKSITMCKSELGRKLIAFSYNLNEKLLLCKKIDKEKNYAGK